MVRRALANWMISDAVWPPLERLVGRTARVVLDYVDTWRQGHIACTRFFPGFVVFQHRCNVICLPSMTDQTSCCADDSLESIQELCRKVNQQRVTVIKFRQHKTGDERHKSMTRRRPLDAPQLLQNAEMVSLEVNTNQWYNCSAMRCYAQVWPMPLGGIRPASHHVCVFSQNE